MRHVLITFGGAEYDPITEQVKSVFAQYGCDDYFVYDDVWLDSHPFRHLNAWLWEPTTRAAPGRGYGWYAWKPLIILDALARVEAGDVVTFIDGDTRPIHHLGCIAKHAAQEGAMLFASSAHRQFRWCKRDCYLTMGITDVDKEAQAGVARFMAFKCGDYKARQFLIEWQAYCLNPLAQTFEKSVLWQEVPGFEEHRTEQAIMTNLAHKYGYPLHREADQSGEEQHFYTTQPGSYPQLFVQTHMGGPHPRGAGSRFRNMDGWK